MNSTIAEQIKARILESERVESYRNVMDFRARWQTAFETESGRALQKLRLELAPFVSEFLSNSTHGNNDNDRNINIVHTSHLPASA